MLNIPEEVKELYKQDGIYKNIRIVFPNGEHEDICNDNIEQNSVQFTESLCSQDEFTLGITESPTFQADIHCAQDITGCVIDVFNEIDCTSLGSEFCAQYCEYKNDLGIYVYSIQYGQFTITSAKLSHANDKRSIDAYGNGINYDLSYSDTFKFFYKFPFVYDTKGMMAHFSEITALATRRVKDIFTGGIEVSLDTGEYEYIIANNKKIKVIYDYYNGKEFTTTQSDGSIFHTGLISENRLAVIDYDVDSRENDLYVFINNCFSHLNENEKEKLNALLTDTVKKSLYNPRYTMAFYKSLINRSTYDTYVNYDEFFSLSEFLPCEGYEFYMKELYSSGGINNYYCSVYSNLTDESLTDRFNEDNLPCCYGRLYIPKRIEFISSGNVVESVDYLYDRLEIKKQVKSILGFWGDYYYEGFTYFNANNGMKVENTRTYTNKNNPNDKMTTNIDYYCHFVNVDKIQESIFEFIGASMLVNREGVMDMVFIKDMFSSIFPSETLYPSEELYPAEADTVISPSLYIEAEYGENIEKPYGRIDFSSSYYINIYDDYELYPEKYKVYDLSDNYMMSQNCRLNYNLIFENVKAALENAIYMPCDIEMKALPYLEVGDTLQVVTATGGFQTIINRRTIKGEQHLTDNIEVN